jgi:HSP20 family protein
MDRFHAEIEKLFYGLFTPANPLQLLYEGTWRPLMDVYELGKNLVVKMELPGVNQADISVVAEGRKLSVRGIRKHPNETGMTYHQMEINYGEFERILVLPDLMHEKDVKVEYREGFLYIIIPRGHG